ncbi:MAG TPA: DUF2059 domain-containing protein [Burkholderiales bacterium]|nr:DUF2059 domain-containing protein [Burkholderiales bacterium]
MSASCLGVANADDASRGLAKQFVALMRYADHYQEYHLQCLASAKSLSPDMLVRQSPDRFFGIQPGSPLWPDVVKAYDQYYDEVCARPTQDEFLDAVSAAYAAELSAQEMQDAIKFYSSPLGQRLLAANKTATRNVYRAWHRINEKQIPIADGNFNRRMAELSAKARGK